MKRWSLLLVAFLPLVAHADEAAIRQTLTQRYPMLSINAVSPSPIPGVYEVWAGGKLFYSDEKGDYILLGPLVDTRTKSNLTRQHLETLLAVRFDSLPLDKAIRIVHGKGERRLAVFSDPDCPFCRRLERELAGMDNLTVYVFLFPITRLHPGAAEVAKRIWCSANPARSWQDYMLEGKAPTQGADCDTPIKALAELGEELGVDGTPTLIFGSGRRLSGVPSKAQLEELLQGDS